MLLFVRILNKSDIRINQNVAKTNLVNNPDMTEIKQSDEIEFMVMIDKSGVTESIISYEDALTVVDFSVEYSTRFHGKSVFLDINTTECSEEIAIAQGRFNPLRTWCFTMDGKSLGGSPGIGDSSSHIVATLQI